MSQYKLYTSGQGHRLNDLLQVILTYCSCCYICLQGYSLASSGQDKVLYSLPSSSQRQQTDLGWFLCTFTPYHPPMSFQVQGAPL